MDRGNQMIMDEWRKLGFTATLMIGYQLINGDFMEVRKVYKVLLGLLTNIFLILS